MQLYTKPCYAALSLDTGYNVIRKADSLHCFCQNKLAGMQNDALGSHLLSPAGHSITSIGIDDLITRRIPDKMISKPDINRIWLY